MLSIHDSLSMQCAFACGLPPTVEAALCDYHATALANGVDGMSHYLILQPGDTDDDIQAEIGFSLLTNPLDGSRYGDPAFRPYWDWLEARDGVFVMTVAVGDSGFAYIILVPSGAGACPVIAGMFADQAA